MQLHQFQAEGKADIYGDWGAGARNVLGVYPTGSGKTVLKSCIVSEHRGASCVIAHRQELVGQISLTLAKYGVLHNIIAPDPVRNWIASYHMAELGRIFIDSTSQTMVASVKTLISRKDRMKAWADRVTLWVIDEAHHVLLANQWGQAVSMFPNARGLGVTATPLRADGNGLGSHADGVFDSMVVGPSVRELINLGHLCDYRIYSPDSGFRRDEVRFSPRTGDANREDVQKQSGKIVGGIVDNYIKYAAGKLGVTFVSDVPTAGDVAREYNARGVSAEVLSAKTPPQVRAEIDRRFRRREILQLVNVDIAGEGYDLPALEVVSMARPSESFAVVCQQFGRPLRPDGDKVAIVIDHVGNMVSHARAEEDPSTGKMHISLSREWSLDRRPARRGVGTPGPGEIPVTTCRNPACAMDFPATLKVCPGCKRAVVPIERSGPEFVDGDLTELSAEALRKLQDKIDEVDAPVSKVIANMQRGGAPDAAVTGAGKQHRLRQQAQTILRDAIAHWGGLQRYHYERPDDESYKRFYFRYGIDVKSAQALGRPDAEKLSARIWDDLNAACDNNA